MGCGLFFFAEVLPGLTSVGAGFFAGTVFLALFFFGLGVRKAASASVRKIIVPRDRVLVYERSSGWQAADTRTRLLMAKEELIQFEGLVLEALPDTRFRVQLDSGHEIIAYTAGKMKKNRIKTLAGDRVTVEMSPYDLEKGRLIFRHKDERGPVGLRPGQRPQFLVHLGAVCSFFPSLLAVAIHI